MVYTISFIVYRFKVEYLLYVFQILSEGNESNFGFWSLMFVAHESIALFLLLLLQIFV